MNPFTPQEEARLDAEAEAADRKAISRWPSWRGVAGEASFTIKVFFVLLLAAPCLLAQLVATAALIGFVLALLGADLGMSPVSFLGVFAVSVVVWLVGRFLLHLLKGS